MELRTAEILRDCIWQIYREGLTTASGGNISSKDDNGNIWISPSQIDKGFLRTEDFACVNAEGVLMNSNKPSMEFPFHQAIYKSDPEVEAVCHLHSPVLVALSLLVPNEGFIKLLDDFDCAYAKYAIPGSEELGENICKALAKKPTLVIMQNHGVIAIGKTIREATDKIRKLSKQIQDYFKIKNSVFNSLSDGKFDFEHDKSVAFYENRAKHFLSLDGEINFSDRLVGNNVQAIFHLSSLKKLQALNLDFSSKIIPESYLLLHKMTSIKNDGKVLVEGHSLFNLYDRMEVLDFTAKVILLANKMGKIQLLADGQIQELEDKFLLN